MKSSFLISILLVWGQDHLVLGYWGRSRRGDPKLFNQCYIKNDVDQFDKKFEMHVFGQHLVRDTVSNALRSHFQKLELGEANPALGPKKALVLSFHGCAGCGKTYTSKFIAESLFEEGWNSKFVHHFNATRDFPDMGKTEIYKEQLQNLIHGSVRRCKQSMFVFDEVNKMGKGLMDAIKPFIGEFEKVHEVDFRNAIFIFLSNIGGELIQNKTLKLMNSGLKREMITFDDLDELVAMGAFNEEGGLQKGNLIKKKLIDYHVPFLPLEREHVKLCIEAEAKMRGLELSKSRLDEFAGKLPYQPESNPIFSKYGCRGVPQKLDVLISRNEL